MVNTISCPALCVFAPLREALPGLYQQSPIGHRDVFLFPGMPSSPVPFSPEGHVKVRKSPGSAGSLPASMQASRLRSQVF